MLGPALPPSATALPNDGGGGSEAHPAALQSQLCDTQLCHLRQGPAQVPQFTDLANGSERGDTLHDSGGDNKRQWCAALGTAVNKQLLSLLQLCPSQRSVRTSRRTSAAHPGGGLLGQKKGAPRPGWSRSSSPGWLQPG